MNAKEQARRAFVEQICSHCHGCRFEVRWWLSLWRQGICSESGEIQRRTPRRMKEQERDYRQVKHTCVRDAELADAYAAAAVAEGNLEMLLLLEWLARRGDDPIWQGLQVNYCPATGVYTYFGYRASREITRAEALALLEGGAGDKGRGTNNTTCNP